MTVKLSTEAEMWISYIFPPQEREQVRRILTEECGSNISFLHKIDESGVDRLRFAVLKLSDGNLQKLEEAISLGKRDWRDLLVASGFADDTQAHKNWSPDRRWNQSRP